MTAAEIAETLSMPLSTVSAVLRRQGMGKLGRIGLEPAVRYERSRPGELLHIDVKKLGRFREAGKRAGFRPAGQRRPRRRDAEGHDRGTTGWEYVHVAVDDYSRLAYAEVLTDEKATTAVAFIRRALAFYARHGITVERVLTDNGSAYISTFARDRLPPARRPPPPHQTTPTPNKRQSRTLHPHPDQRLGLRRHLPLKHRTNRRP